MDHLGVCAVHGFKHSANAGRVMWPYNAYFVNAWKNYVVREVGISDLLIGIRWRGFLFHLA